MASAARERGCLPPRGLDRAEQLDRGIDVLITNPELVKTGLTCWSSRPSFLQSATTAFCCSRPRLALMARRPEAAGADANTGLRQPSQMTCLELMGSEDHGVAEHLRRRA